uniref:Uncharacterized protein n=1 Tax=Alexandrium monilatum TaxID=311494 RepID=A0A7S4QK52_9DINO|mmetsp:Transcript_43545/g.136239  ORF Transcript_43545/g.136239 Transcript_43545/m.136239 type:complete len:129 (+) Transcript_43545:128-514(+)
MALVPEECEVLEWHTGVFERVDDEGDEDEQQQGQRLQQQLRVVRKGGRRKQRQAKARGEGECDVSGADLADLYEQPAAGSGGDPPAGGVISEMIVEISLGECVPQGVTRCSGIGEANPPETLARMTSP